MVQALAHTASYFTATYLPISPWWNIMWAGTFLMVPKAPGKKGLDQPHQMSCDFPAAILWVGFPAALGSDPYTVSKSSPARPVVMDVLCTCMGLQGVAM